MALITSVQGARYRFEISGAAFETSVVEFSAREGISAPYEVALSLASEDEIGFDDAVGKEALFTVAAEGEDRYFHGIVRSFAHTGTRGRFHLYEASVVPSLWLLSLERDCRIFQALNVPDIVRKVLDEGGIASDRFAFRLKGRYAARDYCVQYRETDLAFISRLLEEEGIFYFFEHAEDRHTLVFGDDAVNYKPVAGEGEVTFNISEGTVAEEECVHAFTVTRRLFSGKFTQRDFNFERPSLDLTADEAHKDKTSRKREVYDYPGKYAETQKGKTLARVRLQELSAFLEKGEGKSTCPRLVPGRTFKLKEHDRPAYNREYLLAHVRHEGAEPQALEERAAAGKGSLYGNTFVCIPSSETYRPRRRTPKPVVEGPQTAMVVGPSGEEIYTDKYGRVKVQFHWDREGKKDEKSSCWIRVGQIWAGKGWGSVFIPRVGDEVLVDFLEGDPDRPIIVGSVYNEDAQPLYPLPDKKTKGTIKTKSTPDDPGFNEIRFEDEKGSEQLFIHAQKDSDIRVKEECRVWIGRDRHLIVKGFDHEMVEGDRHVTIKGHRNEDVGGTVSLKAGQDLQQEVGFKHALKAGTEIHLKAGAKVVLEAGASITLKAGGSFIEVGPGGVAISGAILQLNSGGSPGSGSGASPQRPTEPKEADGA
jgi:type VI secretion system secreted protein VgrG